MNPELIKIALENKAILDALKSQIEIQQITTATAPNKPLKSGGLWKIVFVAGVAILGYNVYSYYNNKKRSTN
jgi:hypothetical protein